MNTKTGALLVNRTFPWTELKQLVNENGFGRNLEEILRLTGNWDQKWDELQTKARCPPYLRHTLIRMLHAMLPADHSFNLRYNKVF
jgi:hypothetical protein